MKKDKSCFEMMYFGLPETDMILFPYNLFFVAMPSLSPQCLEEMKKKPQMAIYFPENDKVIDTGLLVNIMNIETFVDGTRLHLEGVSRIRKVKDFENNPAISSRYMELPRAWFSIIPDDHSDYNMEAVTDIFAGIRDAIGKIKETGSAAEVFLFREIILGLWGPFMVNFTPLIKSPKFFSWWLDLCLGQAEGPYKYKQMAFKELNLLKRFEIFVEEILPIDLKYREKNNIFTKIVNEQNIMLRQKSKSQPRNNKTIDFSEHIKTSKMSDEARKTAEDELERLQYINPESAEYSVARTYLDWLVNLPWGIFTEDNFDIRRARQILDGDHAHLNKVKDRIEEYLAVRKLNPDCRGQILCFVGPPGTGKTSIAKSIAKALGRKEIQISLGGIRDDAEIKGHRRTYVGALPGRIIQGIKKAGSQNPVFILDEIDKLCKDFKGDPASALLEVLDPEQNCAFSDHYLNVGFDLSKVLFITTANFVDPIPPALKDRFEIIRFFTYTDKEKLEITKKFLVPKQIKETGLSGHQIKFTDDALLDIIRFYTREAGVRNIAREIRTICQKIAKTVVNQEFEIARGDNIVNVDKIRFYLGAPKHRAEEEMRKLDPGIAIGLAYTGDGRGSLIEIGVEATNNRIEKYILTGSIGKVMYESAQIIITLLQANHEKLGIDRRYFEKESGIHIDYGDLAVSKDGPSAGLPTAVALLSFFKNKPLKGTIAFTGAVNIGGILGKGTISAIGGLKEKILAAKRRGITVVYLPRENKSDIEALEDYVKDNMEFKFVSKLDELLEDNSIFFDNVP